MSDIAIRLAEWESVSPTPGSPAEGVRLVDDPAVRSLASRLSATQMLEVQELRAGLLVRSTSFVGRIRLGPIEITVVPKLRSEDLVRLLRYAYGLRDLHLLPSAVQGTQALGLQDLLVWQLVEEARELLARGLTRAYTRRREALSSPRGRIDFGAIANGAASIGSTLPCAYHRRDEDRLVNRVLLSGLQLAATLATDRGLRLRARRLADLLAVRVSATRLDQEVFRTLSGEMDRMTRSYEPAISLIRILYEAGGLSLAAGEPDAEVPGFLFDMNRFFQALVDKFLSENLASHVVRAEERLSGMFAYVPGWNPRRSQPPTPRPDLLVFRGRELRAILDAKYRDLWEHPLPREMLYQLAIYATSYDAGTAAILYPTVHEQATESRIELRQPLLGERRALVILRPVHLGKLQRLLNTRPSAAAARDRQRYAHEIAFGSGD